MSKASLYFDHCASTYPHPDVTRTVMEVMEQVYANPSSIHDAGGQAEQLVWQARKVIGRSLRVEPEEIIFTAGATESNNLAILGTAKTHHYDGKPTHMIVSEIEHASVYNCYKQLEQEGVEVSYLPVDRSGCVRPEDVEVAIRPHTVLVSIMHVNNETGSIQPLSEIGQVLQHYPKISFHVDGVQGLGKIPIELNNWGADLYSLSGHKVHGPRGVGILVKRKHVFLKPLMYGGLQEGGIRPGTENVPAIVGIAKAIRLAVEEQPVRYKKLIKLHQSTKKWLKGLKSLIINSPQGALGAPHIINISFPGMRAEIVVHALEQQGIIVSAQSACSSKLHKPNRVLLAMTHDPLRAASGIRISLDANSTEENIEQLGHSFQIMIKQLNPLVQRK